MHVKASAIKNVERSIVSGKYYSSHANGSGQARVIGSYGVGTLGDGTGVYAVAIGGAVAEQAMISRGQMVLLPDNLDYNTAAALPNAVIGSEIGLRCKADIQPGDTVLIHGAKGFTGRVAIPIAKHYGAGKIIATGRNPGSLNTLLDLGADEVVPLSQADAIFVAQIEAIHAQTPIGIIIDYLWGHPAELLLAALQGKGSFTHRTDLSRVETVACALSHIESVYNQALPDGKRLVIVME
ncbi:hypothetical protein LZG74_11050 [Dyadobacter sp. CY327]|uniref:hypothetical protein n=1 Tax=Dyadobacter sp. CY327 TaxID=2907301 RepID=UPI001F19001F|nr:hypothetical protein [Dyadobacter sp. CY327]MCE7070843.1 hypothetical protein [Dyadobacter sp. CY327]